jgi:phosphotransferase system HPr (HPr) family protein
MNDAPLQRKVTVNNPNGLHMRPIGAFVELANGYQSSVVIVTHDGRSLNGKSPWDLMTLGEAGLPGSELVLQVDGPDADAALEALAAQLAAVPAD